MISTLSTISIMFVIAITTVRRSVGAVPFRESAELLSLLLQLLLERLSELLGLGLELEF